MRNFINIAERWDIAFGNVDVFRNPSRSEFLKLLKISEYHDCRAFILGNNDLLIWDATRFTHSQMHNQYNGLLDDIGGYLYLDIDKIALNDLNYYYNDEEEGSEFRFRSIVRNVVNAVQTNPCLIHIYRDKINSIIGYDNATGETFNLTPEWIAINVAPD